MDRCGGCDKPMRPKQARCSCGWKAFGSKDFVNPRHGLCEYNDHGMNCGNAGSISLHNGEGGPWYCSEHALGLKGMTGKKSKLSIKEYMASVREQAEERKAIQGE